MTVTIKLLMSVKLEYEVKCCYSKFVGRAKKCLHIITIAIGICRQKKFKEI